MLERIEALPGVEAAGVSNLIPLGSSVSWASGTVTGQEPGSVMAEMRSVSPRYFAAMGIDVVAGRSFDGIEMTPGAGVPPSSLIGPVRDIIRDVAPTAPLAEVQPMSALVGRSLSTRRAGASLMGAFAIISLLLASIGTYGLISFRVASSSREIRIRMALGARAGQVARTVTRFGLVIAAAGILVGIPLALATSWLLDAQLFGIGGLDPVSFGVGALALLVVSSLAAWLPARRAARLDPARVLRSDRT